MSSSSEPSSSNSEVHNIVEPHSTVLDIDKVFNKFKVAEFLRQQSNNPLGDAGRQIHHSDDDIFDFLKHKYGFQKDNVRNQREHLALLIANRNARMSYKNLTIKHHIIDVKKKKPPKHHHSTDTMENAIAMIYGETFENYKKWCRYVKVEKYKYNGTKDAKHKSRHKLLLLSLYLLIWGEAANLRFMPECLCYIFHKLSDPQTLYGTGKRWTDDEDNKFLNHVVTPIYNIVRKEAKIHSQAISGQRDQSGQSRLSRAAVSHSTWRNYDDLNELFWKLPVQKSGSSEWERDLVEEMRKHEKHKDKPLSIFTYDQRKTLFVERRNFLHGYHSFHRLWIFNVLMLQALVVYAFHPRLEFQTVKLLLSLGPTYAFMQFFQSLIEIGGMWGAYAGSPKAFVVRIYLRLFYFGFFCGTLTYTYIGALKEEIAQYQNLIIYLVLIAILAIQQTCSYFFPSWKFLKYLKETYYVGRGMRQPHRLVVRYGFFWIMVLATKLIFSYFFQIKPLVGPTRIIVREKHADYKWHDFISKKNYNVMTVICIWAPIILVYFFDTQIWYTVFSAVVGCIIGGRANIGEIRSMELFEEHFKKFPRFFMKKMIHQNPKENKLPVNENKLGKTPVKKFAPYWNIIVTKLGEEDYLSDGDKQLLEMPLNEGCIEWPSLFLLDKIQSAKEPEKKVPEEVTAEVQCILDEVQKPSVRKFEIIRYQDCKRIISYLKNAQHGEQVKITIHHDVELVVNQMPKLQRSFYERLNRLDNLLNTKESSFGVPKNGEARRRLKFFGNSLLMNMPKAPSVEAMLSFSVLTPHFDEDIYYSLESLQKADADGISKLYYLQTIFPEDWENFLERLHISNKDKKDRHEVERLESLKPFKIDEQKKMKWWKKKQQQVIDIEDHIVIEWARRSTTSQLKALKRERMQDGEMVPERELQKQVTLGRDNRPEVIKELKEAYKRRELENRLKKLEELEQNPDMDFVNELKNKYCDELRDWASYRGQTLARTVRGMMYYEEAIKFQHEQEQEDVFDPGNFDPSLGRNLAKFKFTYVVACQKYADFVEARDRTTNLNLDDDKREKMIQNADDIENLMKLYPSLRVAYIAKVKEDHYSKLIKFENGVQEIYSIKLPGEPLVGEGKPENQNHAIIFTRGEAIQAIDMNQDNYFEEALKVRNLLEEFERNTGKHKISKWKKFLGFGRLSRRTILGLREHVFTGSISSLAWFMSNQEMSFVTIGQRVMANLLRVRMHYGHPDFFNRLFHITRGGMSKASKTINLSEDIFAGFNTTLRGGYVTHHEYIQAGKGRDLSLNQISTFEAKVSSGNGEQLLSRDVYRLGRLLDFFRMLSFYYTSVGYYFSTMLTLWSLYAYLYGQAYLALSGVEGYFLNIDHLSTSDIKGLTGALSTQMLFQIGIFTCLPMVMEHILEHGFNRAIREVVTMQLLFAAVFFVFSLGTKAHYFGRTVLHGGAKYRKTGRGFVIEHIKFAENFRLYSRSHFYKAFEIMMLLIVYFAYKDKKTTGVIYILMSIGNWFLALSWLYAPFIFNPLGLEWQKTVEDLVDWNAWLKNESVVAADVESWQKWWEDQYKIKTLRSMFLEVILSLRFFLIQYGLSFHLSSNTNLLVYLVSWVELFIICGIIQFMLVSRKSENKLRALHAITSLLIFALIAVGVLYLLNLKIKQVIASILSLIPTFYGLLSIGLALRPLFSKWTCYTNAIRSMAWVTDAAMGYVILGPLVFFSYFPFISPLQTRILFNSVFSRGMEISVLLSGKRNQE